MSGSFTADSALIGNTVLTNTGRIIQPSMRPAYRTDNAFVAKLRTATGVWRWAVQSTGDGSEYVQCPLVDAQGQVYVSGSYSWPAVQGASPTPVSFGPIALMAGQGDRMVAQIDTAGQWQTVWPVRNGGAVGLTAYQLDGQGGFYFTGTFAGASATLDGITLLRGNNGLNYTSFLGQTGRPVLAVAQPIAARPELSVYPNPTHGAVTVSGPAPGQAVQVLDVLGRCVGQGQMPAAGPLQLALPAGQAAGVYVVKSSRQARRLVLQ